jgi:hypothetical protein
VQSVRHSEVVVVEQSEVDSDCGGGSPGPGGGPCGTGDWWGLEAIYSQQTGKSQLKCGLFRTERRA